MPENNLIDSFGRQHEYLRISLTDACNLRCKYCMPNEKFSATPSAKLMSVAEIESIAKTFIKLGIKKIRLTGGEPFMRKDISQIISILSELPVKLVISTNAYFVDRYINELKAANISSINVSLDSLNEEEFKRMTQRDDFKKIMSNIELLLNNEFNVKVNMVVMKGINDHAVLDFIEYTKNNAIEVRFIEFMPFSGNQWQNDKVAGYEDLLKEITLKYTVEKLSDELNDTTKKYKVKNYLGSFGFISTITAPFCNGCNRLRLTADGKMKNCLFSKSEMDLLSALRRGEDINALIFDSVKNKKKERGGQFLKVLESADNRPVDAALIENRSMIKIGG